MSLEARIAELNENIVKLIGVMSKTQPAAAPTAEASPEKTHTPKPNKPTTAEPEPEKAKPETPAVDLAALRTQIGEMVLEKAKTKRAEVIAAINNAQAGAKKLGEVADENLTALRELLEAIP